MGQLTHDEVRYHDPRLAIPHQNHPLTAPSQFFTKLADIFTTRKTKAHGAVFLTQKRRRNLLPKLSISLSLPTNN